MAFSKNGRSKKKQASDELSQEQKVFAIWFAMLDLYETIMQNVPAQDESNEQKRTYALTLQQFELVLGYYKAYAVDDYTIRSLTEGLELAKEQIRKLSEDATK
jgi:hypothetical protein